MTFISLSMYFWYFAESSAESGYSNFYFCHWNVNNITAHKFVKIAVLQADYLIHRFDIIWTYETFGNHSFQSDNNM